jgi:hypothetical protein
LRRRPTIEVVADLAIAGAEVAAQAVEVEVDVRLTDTTAVSPAIFLEGQHRTGAAALRAVLGPRGARAVNVRRRDVSAVRLRGDIPDRFAEEHQRDTTAIADGRLGDDNRYRQKALAIEQPLGRIQLVVLRILELAERALGARLPNREQ